jgi:hypothetical protein
MKKQHIYCQEIEDMLMYKTENELMDWFQENECIYQEPSLLKLMLQDKNDFDAGE